MTTPNYQKLLDKYKALTEEKQGLSEAFLKIEEGTTRIRILPAKKDDDLFYGETITHNCKIEGKYTPITCRKVVNEDCPMDDFISEMWKEHEKACRVNSWDSKKVNTPYSALAREIKGKERYFLNVVNRADESKVMVLAAPKTLFTKILSAMLAVDEKGEPEYGDIVNLKTGHDFKITMKKNKGGFPTYDDSSPAPKSSVAGKAEQIELWMDSLHDFAQFCNPTPIDKIQDAVTKLRAEVEAKFQELLSSGKKPDALATKMAGD